MKAKPLFISLGIFSIYAFSLLAFAVWQIGPVPILAWFTAGVFSYSLTEYIVHRYIFHIVAHSEKSRKFQYSIHGNHHEDPGAETQVMMRPGYAIMAIIIITLLFYFPLGINSLAFIPGFISGYGFYLFIHFAYHEYRPPKNFLRALWKHHYLHHHFCDSKNYGVSSPLWDIIFGTRITSRHNTEKHVYEYHHHH